MPQFVDLAQQAGGISEHLEYVEGTKRLPALTRFLRSCLGQKPAGAGSQHRAGQGADDNRITLLAFKIHGETSWGELAAGLRPGVIV